MNRADLTLLPQKCLTPHCAPEVERLVRTREGANLESHSFVSSGVDFWRRVG